MNGTSVSTPQSEQVTLVISLGPLLPPLKPPRLLSRLPPRKEFPLSLKPIFVSPPLIAGNYRVKTRLYKIYCAICHSEKLDGQGPIVASGKYSVAAANLMDLAKFGKTAYPDGKVFHTITYGKGQMGGYGSQLNNKQRWMVVNYIRSKQDTTSTKPVMDAAKPVMVANTNATKQMNDTASKAVKAKSSK